MLKTLFTSPNRAEADLVRARLEGGGFHPVLTGAAQHSSLMPMLYELESGVAVPEAEAERAEEFLNQSRLKLEGTQASGELADGSVCPVHEGPAVAVCDRCGTFLCAKCGSLGVPPVCEECVVRPEKARGRPAWVTLVARVGVLLWAAPLLFAAVGMLFYLLRLVR